MNKFDEYGQIIQDDEAYAGPSSKVYINADTVPVEKRARRRPVIRVVLLLGSAVLLFAAGGIFAVIADQRLPSASPPERLAAGGQAAPGSSPASGAPVSTSITSLAPSPTTVPPTRTSPPTPTAMPRTGAEMNLTSSATADASSVLAPEQTSRYGLVRFDPSNVLDRNPSTSWVEGVAGAGLGEHIDLRFSRPVVVTRLGIDGGFDRDEPIFYANNRVRRARIVFSDGSTQHADFLDRRGIQYVTISGTTTTSISIMIQDVFPGSRYDDTPIAEVEVWGYTEAP